MITTKEQEQLNCIHTTDLVKELIDRLENSNAIEFIGDNNKETLSKLLIGYYQ